MVISKLQFEATGEWQAKHNLWLDMCVKPSGEYKNPSFRIVGDMIVSTRIHAI